MTGQIQLIYLDDNPVTSNLVTQTLEKQGGFEVTTVTSGDEAVSLLSQGRFDAVVTEYGMAVENGINLIRYIREKGNRIPFIIFTSKGRESIASFLRTSCISQDTFLDTQDANPISELTKQIRDAVNTNRLEQEHQDQNNSSGEFDKPHEKQTGDHRSYDIFPTTERDFYKSKEFLENLISLADVPIIIWDPAFRIVRVNHAFELLIGMPGSEVIGKSLVFLFPPDQAERSFRILQTTRDLVRLEKAEIDVLHRDGSVRSVLWNSATLYTEDGQSPVGTIAQGHDISGERKLEQEKAAALVQIQKNLAQLSILNDEIRNPLMIIATYADMISDTRIVDQIISQVGRINEIVTTLDKRWAKSEKVLDVIRKHYQIQSNSPEQDDIEPNFSHDNELFIEEIQAQLYTILDSIDALVYVADMNTHELLFMNRKGRHTYGDVIGQKCHQVLYQNLDGPCPFCTNTFLMDASGPVGVYQWEYENPATGKWYDCRDRAIRWSDGRLVRLEIATDITKRKEAEERLSHVTRLYAMLSNIDQAIVRIPDQELLFLTICRIAVEQGRFHMAWIGLLNEETGKIEPIARAGHDDGYLDTIEIIVDDPKTGIGPTGSAFARHEIITSSDIGSDQNMSLWREEALKRGYRSSAAVPLFCREKPVGTLNLYATEPDYFTADELELLTRVGEDISFGFGAMLAEKERIKALKELQESEKKYRTLAEHVHDGIYIYQGDRFVYVNSQVSQITGYSKEELHSMNFWSLIDPSDYARVLDIAQRRQEGKPVPDTYEVRILTKDGLIKYAELAVSEITFNGSYAALGAARDITDTRIAGRSLRESEDRYRKLIEEVPDYILVHQDGRILFVNTAAAAAFGYSREDLIGSHILSYLTPESQALVKRMMEQRFSGNNPPSYEITIIDKNGKHRITEVRGVLIQFDGEPASLNVLTDITERKKVEDALRRSKGQLHTLVQTIPDLIWLKDVKGVYLSCNRMFERFFGAKEEEIIGKTDYDFVSRELADFFREHDQKAIVKGEPSVNEEWITFADDGHEAFLETIKTPMYDSEGTLIGVLGIGRDITERKLAEDELLAAQEKLSEAHHLATIGTWEWIQDTDVVTWSPEMYRIAGRDPALPAPSFTGHPRYYTPTSWEQLHKAVSRALETGETYNLELELVREDGNTRWTNEIGRVTRDRNGIIIGLHGTIQDIHERKRAEQALHEANHKLHLLTSLTRHDILNQVAALGLLQELCLKSSDIATIHEYITHAQKATELIEKTIGFTREYEDFGAHSSEWQRISQTIEAARDEVILGYIQLENLVSPELEVYGDPIIRKVFSTLIENAVRHGEDITVIRFTTVQDDDQCVIFCEDDGIGIPAYEKEQIFDHGYGKNTGIGLFLAREILSITGLSIRENGIPGTGARFEILVPAGRFRSVKKVSEI